MKPWPAIVLVACGGATPPAREAPAALPSPPPSASPEAARVALFPEDPTLDGDVVADPKFTQETWTSTSSGHEQHCREWAFDPSRQNDVRDAINARLASRGVHLPDKARVQGVVVALGSSPPGVVDRGPLAKLVVCTEGVAKRAAHEDFSARLLASPRAPRGGDYDALGEPDVAWERFHATGEVEIGFRWQNADPAVAARIVAAIAAANDVRFKARMRGADLWWTGLEK